MNAIKATRRSKFGFGYNTNPTGNGTEIEATTSPNFTGTIKQVIEQIQNDRTYQSLRNNTYHTTAWFIRHNGEWVKINTDRWEVPATLLEEAPDNWGRMGYMQDSIEVYPVK